MEKTDKNPRGAGAKLRDPEKGKRITVSIRMRPDHVEATAGNRSVIVEKALDKWIDSLQQ